MGHNAATAFRAGVERIEQIDGEIEELKEQIKALMGQRKGTLDIIRVETGFIPKVTQQIVKERRLEPEIRTAFLAQIQVARATMGMLDGTPLGDAARRAYDPKPGDYGNDDEPKDGGRIDDKDQDDFPWKEPTPLEKTTQEDLDHAWQEGVQAARDGKRLTENPYPADKPLQRAHFDEGWCHEKGSDGMDVPEALQPKKQRKKDDDSEKKAA